MGKGSGKPPVFVLYGGERHESRFVGAVLAGGRTSPRPGPAARALRATRRRQALQDGGGRGRAEHRALADALKADGIATWNVEYRRLGEAAGGWPGTYEDGGRAADHVRALAGPYALDLGRVVVGHS